MGAKILDKNIPNQIAAKHQRNIYKYVLCIYVGFLSFSIIAVFWIGKCFIYPKNIETNKYSIINAKETSLLIQERYDNLLDIVFGLCNYNQTHPL